MPRSCRCWSPCLRTGVCKPHWCNGKWLWKSKNHVLVNSWKSWICLENNKIKAGRSYILWTNLFLFFMLASFTEFHFRVIVHTQYSKPSWKFWTSDKGLGEKNGDESKTSEVFRLVETTGSREEKKKKKLCLSGILG